MREKPLPARVKAQAWVLGLVLASALTSPARASSQGLSFSGRVTNLHGKPLDGPVDISVKFWTNGSSGNQLGSQLDFPATQLAQGVFQLNIVLKPQQLTQVFGDGSSPVFIEVTAAGKTYPRQQFLATPFALRVPADPRTLTYDSNGNLTLATTSQPQDGQFLTKDGAGNLTWAAPSGSASQLNNRVISSQIPAAGQALVFDGSNWTPQTVASGGSSTVISTVPPLAVGGTATNPLIQMSQASSVSNGYVSSSDYVGFSNMLSRSGGTMAGALNMGTQALINLPLPSAAGDAATKGYVDTATNGGLKKDGTVALTGPWNVGTQDLTSVGNMALAASKTLGLGTYATDPAGLSTADKGKIWFNTTTNQLKYWDGALPQTLGVSGAGLTSLGGQSGSTQTFNTTLTGTAPGLTSSANVHTLNVPLASASGSVTAGLISNADYVSFSGVSTNTASTVVKRDGSGNFAAGTITANLTGNVTGNASTATSAGSFTGALGGDITGTQAATVVASVGGVVAANVAAGASLANAGTNANTASTLVKRDGSGNFTAGMITANLTGNVTGNASTATSAGSFTGPLAGDVSGTQTATVVSAVGGSTATNVHTAELAANAATASNSTLAIVKRDSNGAFSSGQVSATTPNSTTQGLIVKGSASQTANLQEWQNSGGTVVSAIDPSGYLKLKDNDGTDNYLSLRANPTMAANLTYTFPGSASAGSYLTTDASGNLSWGTPASVGFSGSLSGDVTGTQSATAVANVGGVTAANVAAGANLASAGTNANTASTLVKRDASGNFTAGVITAALVGNASTATTSGSFTGALVGDVTGTQAATVVANVGGLTATSTAAGANLANAATNANTASTLVKRDASGNFAASMITSNLTGNVTGNASTANSAGTFTGPLLGDVTGTQGATVVSTVAASTAANVHAAELAANAATASNSTLAIVKRDINGGFSSGQVNATTPNSTTQGLIVKGSASQSANLQEWQNSGGTVVSAIDPSGYLKLKDNDGTDNYLSLRANPTMAANLTYTFPGAATAGGYLTTDASGTLTWSTPGTFTGSLAGDVTGPQGTTVVANVGGLSAGSVAAGANLANAGTNANTASTLVKRDGSGNFTAGTITASLIGAVTGNVTGTATNVSGIVLPANGGSGVANGASSTFTRSGNFPLTTTLTAATTVTLPTSGTLATLAGTETLTSKTLTSPVLVTPALGTPASGVATNLTGLPLSTGVTGTLPVGNGGTGLASTPANGQLLIGNATNYSLATLTGGNGITVTNGSGSINIASTVTPSSYVAVAGSTMTGTLNLQANGLIAGTNQLVLSGGNVGVGTTAPAGILHIAGTTTIHGAGEGAIPSAATIRGANAAGSDTPGANLTLQAGNGTGTGGSGSIIFQTAPIAATSSTANALASPMAITPAGNVGIGTTAPIQTLEVSAAGGLPATSGSTQNGMMRFRPIGNAHGLDIGVSGVTPYGSWLQATNRSNLAVYYPLNLQPNGGNVGIGTSSPSSSLQVGSTVGSGTQSIILQGLGNYAVPDTYYNSIDFYHQLNAGNNQATWRILSRGKQASGTSGNFEISGGSYNNAATFNASPYFAITQSGSVGIGTTAPMSGVGSASANYPANWTGLHVKQPSSAVFALEGTTNARLEFANSGGAVNGRGMALDFGTGGALSFGSLTDALGSSKANILVVDGVGGNVGIGTTAPSNTLQVIGSFCVKSSAAACAGSSAGSIYATTTTIAAADLAEHMPASDQSLGAGDVVVIGTSGSADAADFKKSTTPNQANAAGVVSTSPGVALGSETAMSKPVALAGRVPVNVTLEGGTISIGDYLVSSSTPGKAMRAKDSSASGIIGVALSNYDGSPVPAKAWGDSIAHETGHQVMMLVQVGAGSQAAVAHLKARADKAESDAAQLRATTEQLKQIVCAQSPTVPFCH